MSSESNERRRATKRKDGRGRKGEEEDLALSERGGGGRRRVGSREGKGKRASRAAKRQAKRRHRCVALSCLVLPCVRKSAATSDPQAKQAVEAKTRAQRHFLSRHRCALSLLPPIFLATRAQSPLSRQLSLSQNYPLSVSTSECECACRSKISFRSCSARLFIPCAAPSTLLHMSLEPLQALASDGFDRRASASLLHALHEFSITTGVGSSVYVKGHDVVLS